MNICDLRRRVSRFAENIDEEALREMVLHNRKRAALCIDSPGQWFPTFYQWRPRLINKIYRRPIFSKIYIRNVYLI